MNPPPTIRAAVIGLGAMGANHARVYAEIPGVELAAVAESDEARLATVTLPPGTARYAGFARMLDEVRPHAVSVSVPTRLHLDVASAAIERGIAVLVEKPLAATIFEGRALRDLAAHAGVLLSTGHVERFNPAVVELKRRLQARELGRIFQVHARRVGPFPQRVRDVGVALDLAPHDIDVMRFLLGSDIVRVHAETEQRINTDHEDMLLGTLRFANGVVGVLDVNWLTPTKIRELSVLGERGMFVVDYLARSLTLYENDEMQHEEPAGWAARHAKGVSEGPRREIPVERREPLRVELEAFIDAVRTGGAAPVPPDDALAAMHAAEALVRSGATGETITLPVAASA